MALDLNDKTSNGNTLTNNASVTEVTSSLPFAQSTSAAGFVAASSQYLSALDSASLSLSTTGTLEGWFKFTTLPSAGNTVGLLGKDDEQSQRAYDFLLRNTGGVYTLEGTVLNGLNQDYYTQTWSTPVTGTWYHLAMTMNTGNPSATTFEFFVNAVSLGNGASGVANNIATISDTTARFVIGALESFPNVTYAYLDGFADEIRVWNTVRTQAQLSANMSIELGGGESGLVAYWPLESTLGVGGSNLINFEI